MTWKIDFESQKLTIFVSWIRNFGKRYENCLIGHFWSVAKVLLGIWCGTWNLNLKRYLFLTTLKMNKSQRVYLLKRINSNEFVKTYKNNCCYAVLPAFFTHQHWFTSFWKRHHNHYAKCQAKNLQFIRKKNVQGGPSMMWFFGTCFRGKGQ